MKQSLKKLFAMLLTVSMVAGLLSTASFAEGETTDPGVDAAPVDPYVYYYNGYDVNVSPHALQDTKEGGHWTMIFRLDEENYLADSGYEYNEADRQSMDFGAYCSDLETSLYRHTAYKRINLEDSTYYDDATAAKIRGVLACGYWPGDWDLAEAEAAANEWLVDNEITVPVEVQATDPETGEPAVDGDGNHVMETVYVQAEIKNLTNAEALSATQGAIWNYANTTDSWEPNLSYDYTMGADYMESSCGSTTVDAVNVDYKEAAQNATKDNIDLFILYLMGQEGVAPSKIIFSDKHFVTSKAVFTGTGTSDTTYEVSLRFKLDGDFDADDDLILSAKLADRDAVEKPLVGTDALQAEEDGYYTLVFRDVTAEEAEKGIHLSVSGYQEVDDIYFYEPEPDDAEDEDSARDSSQNLVGKAKGSTAVYAEQNIEIDLDTKDAELIKYVGDATVPAGSENAVQIGGTEGEWHPLLPGAVFDLYAKIGDDYVLVESDLTTDANGRITVKDLADGYNYYFLETSAPDGYICEDDYHKIQWPDGTVTIENCFDVADLSLSKSVKGVPTDEHFTFTIALDLSTADLVNAESLITPAFEADWSGIGNNCFIPGVVEGDAPTAMHQAEITFAQEGEILTADVVLKDGESLTIKGIPTGTSYTITEADNSYTPEGGSTQEGTVGQKDQKASFLNVKYNATDAEILVKKTVDSAEPGEDTFTFELYQWDADEQDWVYVDTAENDAVGNVLFEVRYTQPGEDLFRIWEKNEGGAFVYDSSIYYAKVKVTSDRGDLNASVKYYEEFENGRVQGTFSGLPPVFNNKAYKDGSLYLSGVKYLDGELSEKPFTFELYDVTDSRHKLDTTQSGAGGVFQFDEIRFTEPGTYVYEVSEEAALGFLCDTTVYTVTVTVERDLVSGEMIVGEPVITMPNPEPAPDPLPEGTVYQEIIPADGLVFRNTTKRGNRVPDDAKWQLKGTKTLDGEKAGGFTFKMVDEKGNESIVTSKADGSITFPKQTYDEKGTYTYTITEVAGGDETIVYDPSVYTVTVTVKKVAGDYEVTEVAITEDGEKAASVTFENTTSTTEIPEEPTPTGDKPDGGESDGGEEEEIIEEEIPLAAAPATGDVSALWLALSAISGTGLAGTAFLGRKKRED